MVGGERSGTFLGALSQKTIGNGRVTEANMNKT